MRFPETGFLEDGREGLLCGGKRSAKAVKEPQQPVGDVSVALLGFLHALVILLLESFHIDIDMLWKRLADWSLRESSHAPWARKQPALAL